MAQSIQCGDVMTVVAASGGVGNGDLVIQGRMAGVALNTAAVGESVSVALEGVYALAAVATGTKDAGARVFYRTTGGKLKAVFASGTATGTTKYTIGTVWKSAAATATSVEVRLLGGPMAAL